MNGQLLSRENVEFIIRPIVGGFGHVMTLTGMTWQDLDSDGVIDPDEATIDYIDPNGGPGQAPIDLGRARNGPELWSL